MCRSLVALLLLAAPALAQKIDFEALPTGGRPADGATLDNQWRQAPFNVTFSLEGLAILPQAAWAGGPRTAFEGVLSGGVCDTTIDDMPMPGLGAACTFLTDDGDADPGRTPRDLRITYRVPVLEASGVILDIDHAETYRVQAFDRGGAPIAGVFVDLDPTSPGSGNGLPTPWELVQPDPSRPIWSVLIDYTGPDTGPGLTQGFALDDFAPSTTCPDQVTHLGGGIPGAGGELARISVGCPTVGNPGAINIFNAPGGATYCLIIDTMTSVRPFSTCGSAQIVLGSPGATMFEGRLNGPAGAPGMGSVSLPYGPVNMSLAGGSFFVQAAFIDLTTTCLASLSEPVAVKIP